MRRAREQILELGCEPLNEDQRQWVENLRLSIQSRDRNSRAKSAKSAKDDPALLKGELLHDQGDAIIRFLRLGDTRTEADKFRRKYPYYFPEGFWDWNAASDDELYRGCVFLPPLVTNELNPFVLRRPNRQGFPYWRGYRDLLLTAWRDGFTEKYRPRLLNQSVEGIPDDPEDYVKRSLPKLSKLLRPFQSDLLILFLSPWRARLCRRCGKPFVADRQTYHFCPNRFAANPKSSCRAKSDRTRKLDCWNANKRKYRPD